MPRVPTLDGPKVRTAAMPGYSAVRAPDVSMNFSGLANGLNNLASGVDKEEEKMAKAREEAASVDRANKLLEQQERAQRRLMGGSGSKDRIDDAFDGVDTSKGGFMATRGLHASEQSASVVDALRKDQEEIAATISDPRARQSFMLKSREQLLAYQRQVETHAAKQFEVARDETAKARMGQAIGMAEAGVPDFDAWLTLKRQVDEDIDALAVSPDQAKAQRAAFDSVSGAALVQGMLAQGRAEEAAKYVEENRATLAGKYPEAKALVDRANAGAEKDRQAGEVARLVDTSAEAVRSPDGYVTEEELRKAVPVEGYEGQQRDAIESELRQRIVLEDRRLKADIEKQRDELRRAETDRRPIPGVTRDFLYKYDPDSLTAYDAREKRRFEHWKAMKDGSPAEKAASKKQQDDDDEAFRWRLKARLTEDPTVKPEDVEREFIAERKAKTGRNVMVSDTERERAGFMSVDTQKRATSKDARDEKADSRRIEKAVTDAAKRGLAKGQKVDPTAINDEVGRNLMLLEAAVEANGGKPLDEKQWSAFEETITRELTIEKPGRFFGTTTEKAGRVGQRPTFGPEAPPAPPKPSTITVRRKSDGKTRTIPASDAARFLADPSFEQVK